MLFFRYVCSSLWSVFTALGCEKWRVNEWVEHFKWQILTSLIHVYYQSIFFSFNFLRIISLKSGNFSNVWFQKNFFFFYLLSLVLVESEWFLSDYFFSFSGSFSCFSYLSNFCLLSVIHEDVIKEGQEKDCNSNFSLIDLSSWIILLFTYTALLKYIFLNLRVKWHISASLHLF